MADKDDDLLDRVNEMADRLELTGKERRTYVHEHMTRGGYKAVPQYVRGDEDEDEDESSGFFASSSRRRTREGGEDDDDRTRRRRQQSSRRRRSDDWYDD